MINLNTIAALLLFRWLTELIFFGGGRLLKLEFERTSFGGLYFRLTEGASRRRAFAAIVAGPVVVYLLAIGTCAALHMNFYEEMVPIVESASPVFAEEESPLQPGDRIVAIDGHPIHRNEDIRAVVEDTTGPQRLTVDRDGTLVEVMLTLTPEEASYAGMNGIEWQWRNLPAFPVSFYYAFKMLSDNPAQRLWMDDYVEAMRRIAFELPVRVRWIIGLEVLGANAALFLLLQLLPIPGTTMSRIWRIMRRRTRPSPVHDTFE